MPIRNSRPISWKPKGLTDAADGTNSFEGAMKTLQNVIPDPSTARVWRPRPAAVQLTDFTGINAPANPGNVSGDVVIGDRVYGMVPSSLHAGKDEPFVYDLAAGTFVQVSGITAANVPTSPPAAGEWTPPILAQVASRVIVTHPGFPGGGVKFGWFDVSGFSETTTGNTNTSTLITGNPLVLGVQPGMTISGAGIPAGTTVLSTRVLALVEHGDTHSNTTLDNLTVVVTGRVSVGMTVTGAGILDGTTVAAILGANSVQLSQAATATTAFVQVTFGGATITLSAAATASAAGVALTIAGGMLATPLWGAGDVDDQRAISIFDFPLPANVGLASVPLGVAQMAGRAYFADGLDGIPFSDSGFPCRMSNTLGVQVLTTNDGLSVTAVGPLMLSAPLTGGIVQAIIAFEEDIKMRQITGDQATGNLAMNVMPVATGTHAPLSIVPCELGLAFVSPTGLRFIRFDGTVTSPVGADGQGISQPFQFAAVPSRICAAANAGVIRLTVQNGLVEGSPAQEYWFDLTRQVWHGPHSFPARLIQPWRTSFLVVPDGLAVSFWQSDAYASAASLYVENGAQLTWVAESVLLPDNAAMAMNAMVESSVMLGFVPPLAIEVMALDEDRVLLNTAFAQGVASAMRQRTLDWSEPVVFKQMSLLVRGQSDATLRLGNLYLRYEQLGYQMGDPQEADFLTNAGVVIVDENGNAVEAA